MENFVVSARKYRPATFDTVVGQTHITTTLKNALKSNHLAQAFLFCGPRGVGKTTCARILAKTINCLQPTEEYEACGKCESCVAFQQNGSLNVYELDAASNNSVEDIRNLVEQVRYPPQIGSRKVYIIDEVHMLSQAAFNAFLKTLEEPPSYVIFILATTEKHKIIPTILSRCQIFDFKRIEVKDIAQHLEKISQQEDISAEYDALELIAQKADGGLRDALSLFDMITTFSADKSIQYTSTVENLHILDYECYFQVTEALMTEDITSCLLLLDDVLRRGFDGHNFIVGLATHFRDLMVCKNEKTVRLLEVPEKAKEKYIEQAQKAPSSFLLSALNIAGQCDLHYKSSKNPRLHVELALMKIAHVNAAIHWAENPPVPEEIEKKKLNETPSIKPLIKNAINPAKKNVGAATVAKVNENGASTSMNTSSSKTVKIPKLSQLQKEVTQTAQQPKTQKKDFKKDDLLPVLEFYKKIVKGKVDNSREEVWAVKVLNKVPEILENYVIKFSLEEEENKIFEKFKEHFLDTLKKRLENSYITIQIQLLEAVKEQKPYSNYQKYEYLAERKPLLNKLKEALGLEIDH